MGWLKKFGLAQNISGPVKEQGMSYPDSFLRGTKCNQTFGLAQKNWTVTKVFGTCKRTRSFDIKGLHIYFELGYDFGRK